MRGVTRHRYKSVHVKNLYTVRGVSSHRGPRNRDPPSLHHHHHTGKMKGAARLRVQAPQVPSSSMKKSKTAARHNFLERRLHSRARQCSERDQSFRHRGRRSYSIRLGNCVIFLGVHAASLQNFTSSKYCLACDSRCHWPCIPSCFSFSSSSRNLFAFNLSQEKILPHS